MAENYLIAIYLRLSNEDEEGNLDESNSITSQRDLIKDYIKRNDDLLNGSTVEFCDDGYSGTDFSRPGMLNLLNQVKTGAIHCIIVKDFSRFGRNYIEVGNYLEQVFPFLGVRFISVNDGYDSEKNSSCSEFIGIAFKNLVYDLYSKDISEKIVSVRRAKAQQGKFITAYAPYGYLKEDSQQLTVDEEAAEIVKRIFNMALSGIAKVEIARTLNKEHIPTPLMLRKGRKQHFPCHYVNEKCIWKPSVVSKILKDQRYVGDCVYGKVKPARVGSKKNKPLQPKDWVIVENTHEPIISKDVFEKVNACFKKYNRTQKKEISPLEGKIRCGVCNHAISAKAYRKNNEVFYKCSTPSLTDEFPCYSQNVADLDIEEAVLNILNRVVEIVSDFEIRRFQEAESQENISVIEKNICKKEGLIKKLNTERLKTYESYKSGVLSKELLTQYMKNYYEKISEITFLYQEEKFELSKLKIDTESMKNNFTKDAKFKIYNNLTTEIVKTFIDTIYIQADGSLKIKWKFEDVFKERLNFTEKN